MRPLLSLTIGTVLSLAVAAPAAAQGGPAKQAVGQVAPSAGAAASLALQLALQHERRELLGALAGIGARSRAYAQRHAAYLKALAAYHADLIPFGKNRDDRRAEVAAQLRSEAQYLQREHAAVNAERQSLTTRLSRVDADLSRVRGPQATGVKVGAAP